MSEVEANPSGANTEAAPFDGVNAFSSLLEKEFGGAELPEAEAQDIEATDEVVEDQAEEAEAEDTEEAEAEPVYKVKVSGEEIEVPLSELLNGYSRETDYRHKTMELAETRRQVEQRSLQVNQEYSAQVQQMEEIAQLFLTQLPDVGKPDPSLIETNPLDYLRQREAYDRLQTQRQSAVQVIQELRAEEARRQEQIFLQNKQQGEQIIMQAIPDWADSAKRSEESQAILGHVAKYGFDAAEFSKLTDPRYVVYMRDSLKNAEKAAKYDELMAKSNTTAKRVENLPTRVERPSKGQGLTATDARTKAFQNLRRSGSTDDAAALFAKML